MLSIFIMIGVAMSFARLAHDKDRNRYVWGAIGVVSYFVAQLIAGMVIGLTKPELLQNRGSLSIISIVAGLIGVGIAFFILKRMPNPTEALAAGNDLLDTKID